MQKYLITIFLILGLVKGQADERARAIFHSLDPSSLSQAAAFYELYGQTPEGKRVVERMGWLLNTSESVPIDLLVKALHRFPPATPLVLEESELAIIESIAEKLPNRKLKGFAITSKEEIFSLPPEEIDLSQALLFTQVATDLERRSYIALLDIMALQVLARLPPKCSNDLKIKEMNNYIFEQMRFRFPPHAIYAKNIDEFTFLPKVMDNHIGVCLGVTNLYIALAQRIGLPLEIITPPGHIFVRCREGEKITNIETTARGIHLPCEHYESLNVKEKLKPRSLRETIGMTYVNEASIRWEDGDFEKGVIAYENAVKYLEDPFIHELLAYTYLQLGREKEGKELLLSLKDEISEMGEDFLAGCLVLEGNPSSLTPIYTHPSLTPWPLLILVDDLTATLKSDVDFLWTTFTRFEPAADIHATVAKTHRHHLVYQGPILIDTRMKPSYPPVVTVDDQTNEKVTKRWQEYGSI